MYILGKLGRLARRGPQRRGRPEQGTRVTDAQAELLEGVDGEAVTGWRPDDAVDAGERRPERLSVSGNRWRRYQRDVAAGIIHPIPDELHYQFLDGEGQPVPLTVIFDTRWGWGLPEMPADSVSDEIGRA